ncbi:S-type pyocin domain-containing protein [Pseudomonas koreensis]|uniref:S-type pyocin domain-containing protein n=1 Tax=Pseudomonas koreensis TaxID=198620 RepID=UPI0021C99BE4|nr:S-type pyocin domain-containing protein [Pseudomonas koreensis]MCU0089179.1 S-type pyocin domain-containing protein [Pseudomonas koreensis]
MATPPSGRLEIGINDAVHIRGIAPRDTFIMPPSHSPRIPHGSGMFGHGHGMQMTAHSAHMIAHAMQSNISVLESEFQTRTTQLPQTIEHELATIRQEGSNHYLPPTQAVIRELDIRNRLIARKTAVLQQQSAIANQFFGSDPANKTLPEFIQKASQMEPQIKPYGIAIQAWTVSYRAAHEVRLLSQTIDILSRQNTNYYTWLAASQANDRELARQTAERARIAAEQHRQRALAEAVRQQKVQKEIQAREEARLAALAEVQRLAAEQAQIAAEAIAQQIAAEQARLQAENAPNGQSPVVANAGSMAAFGPTFSGPLGVFGNSPATTLALRTSLRTAVSLALTAISTAAAPVIVGFAALLAPSRLGNGDLYSASVPLSDLAPDLSSDELYQSAAIGGDVDLPVRLGSSTMGDKIEFVVVTTDGLTVPANVPVRAAHFDARTNTYVSTASDTNGPTLTWTPLVQPQDTSTYLPLADNDPPVYDGAEVVPDEGRIDPFPELDRFGFGGFITVFPIESGLPPLLVVFSSPYDGAFLRGKYSGRVFNPNKSGGPILDLDWRSAVINRAGIDAVKLHIARLDQSDANDVMIQRLEEILSGRLVSTDTDLRYYTHEIRELERFRALGLSDAFRPDKESPMWNNAHTATLEDFKLEDNEALLYTKDAIEAADKQDEVFFKNLLKGGKQ